MEMNSSPFSLPRTDFLSCPSSLVCRVLSLSEKIDMNNTNRITEGKKEERTRKGQTKKHTARFQLKRDASWKAFPFSRNTFQE